MLPSCRRYVGKVKAVQTSSVAAERSPKCCCRDRLPGWSRLSLLPTLCSSPHSPSMAMPVPAARMRLPISACLSLKPPARSSLRSASLATRAGLRTAAVPSAAAAGWLLRSSRISSPTWGRQTGRGGQGVSGAEESASLKTVGGDLLVSE